MRPMPRIAVNTGIEIEYDNEGNAVAPFKAGIDHLWVTENPNARFGDFETAGLDQFIKVKDSFRIDVSSVTGTPTRWASSAST